MAIFFAVAAEYWARSLSPGVPFTVAAQANEGRIPITCCRQATCTRS